MKQKWIYKKATKFTTSYFNFLFRMKEFFNIKVPNTTTQCIKVQLFKVSKCN